MRWCIKCLISVEMNTQIKCKTNDDDRCTEKQLFFSHPSPPSISVSLCLSLSQWLSSRPLCMCVLGLFLKWCDVCRFRYLFHFAFFFFPFRLHVISLFAFSIPNEFFHRIFLCKLCVCVHWSDSLFSHSIYRFISLVILFFLCSFFSATFEISLSLICPNGIEMLEIFVTNANKLPLFQSACMYYAYPAMQLSIADDYGICKSRPFVEE